MQVIDKIISNFTNNKSLYIGEKVTMSEHMIQTAMLAEKAKPLTIFGDSQTNATSNTINKTTHSAHMCGANHINYSLQGSMALEKVLPW